MDNMGVNKNIEWITTGGVVGNLVVLKGKSRVLEERVLPLKDINKLSSLIAKN